MGHMLYRTVAFGTIVVIAAVGAAWSYIVATPAAARPAARPHLSSQVTAQAQPIHPTAAPAPTGINWQSILLTCAGVAAVHGLLTKFVIHPELDRKFSDFALTLDSKYARAPHSSEDIPISRRENALLEDQARREHEILQESVQRMDKTVQDSVQRLEKNMDQEFRKIWSALKRFTDRLDQIGDKIEKL